MDPRVQRSQPSEPAATPCLAGSPRIDTGSGSGDRCETALGELVRSSAEAVVTMLALLGFGLMWEHYSLTKPHRSLSLSMSTWLVKSVSRMKSSLRTLPT